MLDKGIGNYSIYFDFSVIDKSDVAGRDGRVPQTRGATIVHETNGHVGEDNGDDSPWTDDIHAEHARERAARVYENDNVRDPEGLPARDPDPNKE
ncbi:MAG TPA: hypothetical protein VGG74_12630 [Kofleriaceae bacterium]